MKGYSPRKQQKPDGVISFATQYLGRYRDFDRCLANLTTPFIYVLNVEEGANIAENQNRAMAKMIQHDLDWIWTLNDDHTFHPDLLVNLLAREVDIVFPLYLYRTKPILPVLAKLLPDGTTKKVGTQVIERLLEYSDREDGLVELPKDILAGGAGMLARKQVVKDVGFPWMEQGKLTPGFGAEDLYFCKKVHDAGYKVYLDTQNVMGHTTHVSVWPVWDKGKLIYTFELPTRG